MNKTIIELYKILAKYEHDRIVSIIGDIDKYTDEVFKRHKSTKQINKDEHSRNNQ